MVRDNFIITHMHTHRNLSCAFVTCSPRWWKCHKLIEKGLIQTVSRSLYHGGVCDAIFGYFYTELPRESTRGCVNVLSFFAQKNLMQVDAWTNSSPYDPTRRPNAGDCRWHAPATPRRGNGERGSKAYGHFCRTYTAEILHIPVVVTLTTALTPTQIGNATVYTSVLLVDLHSPLSSHWLWVWPCGLPPSIKHMHLFQRKPSVMQALGTPSH